jgi:hypothetical protein
MSNASRQLRHDATAADVIIALSWARVAASNATSVTRVHREIIS